MGGEIRMAMPTMDNALEKSAASEHVGPYGSQRLPFLDGLRGLGAAIVALGHMIYILPSVTVPDPRNATLADLAFWPLRFGGEMVYLFLMLSGFALYYSENARRLRGRPATTYRQFLQRRAWRIGPVYYAAVAYALVIVFALPRLPLRPENRSSQEVTGGGVISHLFFLHNLNPRWESQINAPLWTIAFEMQLYLLLPLIFAAMRKVNPVLVLVVFLVAEELITKLSLGFPVFGLLRWFVGGCFVAELLARGIRLPLWVTLPGGLGALLLGMLQLPALSGGVPHDAVWLVAFALLLLAMAAAPGSGRNPMNWSWMRWLGTRSYSLYALHFPIVLIAIWGSLRLGLHGGAAAGFVVATAAPVSLLVTMVSWRFIEGPSLRRVAAVR